MNLKNEVVLLLDVDNTLLDNDRVLTDFTHYIEDTIGYENNKRYWDIFIKLRDEIGYADYLGALQLYRVKYPHDPRLLKISSYILNYPFANRLFPKALEIIDQLKTWGLVVIFSDGDIIYQPRKVESAGLFNVANSNVLIYVHKELALDDVERRYPAEHYILVDDKIRILNSVKHSWSRRVTTIFIRQGHYALDPEVHVKYPPPDLTIEGLDELTTYGLEKLIQLGKLIRS
ncbi:MAG: HAD family hydrolase [Acidobacteriia bacterium]|nr:HAD family hydrolase [Terriglobia bacterium]